MSLSWIYSALVFTLTLLAGAGVHAAEQAVPGVPNHPPINMQQGGPSLTGQVLETMDAGGYTYILLQTGGNKVWAAGPTTPVKQGDTVTVSTGMPMEKFHSKALERDFDLLYFSGQIQVAGQSDTSGYMDPHKSSNNPQDNEPVANITKAEHGKTIAEVFAHQSQLAGQSVRVRGQVVKYTPKVLGKNWLHLQDSSGHQRLVVSTLSEAKIGNVVVAEGKLAFNKDLGYGYVYEVLMEDAKLTVEK